MPARILLINHEYPPIGGGGGVITKEIALGLSVAGYRVEVLTSGVVGGGNEPRSVDEVIVHRLPVRRETNYGTVIDIFKFILAARRWLDKQLLDGQQFDLYWGHFIQTGGYLAAYAAGAQPFLLNILGADLYDPSRFSLIIPLTGIFPGRKVLANARTIFVPSIDMKKRLLERTNTPEKIKLVPHFINGDLTDRTKTGPAPGEPWKIITVARLVKRKRIEIALQAMKLLDENIPVSYCVVGDGPCRKEWEELTRQLGLADRVQFYGRVNEERLAEIYRQGDIFLLTSQHEAFGIVLLEAMQQGIPCLSTRSGGTEDIVIDGENGWLVNDTPEAVAAAIRNIVCDRSGYDRVSSAAVLRTKDFYAKKIMPHYLAEIEHILQEAKHG